MVSLLCRAGLSRCLFEIEPMNRTDLPHRRPDYCSEPCLGGTKALSFTVIKPSFPEEISVSRRRRKKVWFPSIKELHQIILGIFIRNFGQKVHKLHSVARSGLMKLISKQSLVSSIGIASGIGSDFPCPCKKWLEDMRIDSSGLLMCSSPTFRAWQIMEVDGRRTQVRRVYMGDDVWDMLRPPLCSLPMAYRNAKVYHVGVHPSGQDVGFIQELRNSGAEIVSIETCKHARDRVSKSELMALVSAANIFSANEKEAASLVGPGSPLEMIERIAELGAEVVTLRRGPSGSIAHRSDTRETWEIPAFHAIRPMLSSQMQGETMVENVVDPTGCGNTFCGAFLIGWWKTRDLLMAGLWGSVAASFVAEYEGLPPPPLSHWREQAQVRVDILKPYAKKLHTAQQPS